MPTPWQRCGAFFTGLILLCSVSQAALRLPALFSTHMVLQSGTAPVWGWAGAGEVVKVNLAGHEGSVRADATGKWVLTLRDLPAGGPYVLQVNAGADRLSIEDVLVGEVWLGSGQSNMGFPFKGKTFPYLQVLNYEQEKTAADLPQIRMFLQENSLVADSAQEDCRGKWVVAAPEAVDDFSAVLFFFGRDLHRNLRRPVGLIKSAVGGTGIELWIDAGVQRAQPRAREYLEQMDREKARFDAVAAKATYEAELAAWEKQAVEARQTGKKEPRKPNDPAAMIRRNYTYGGLFNSKIAPLIPYGISGIVWYQGEANAGIAWRAPYYREQLPLLVTDWRKRWGRDVPFAWVQLANFEQKAGDWPLVREAMLEALQLPRTGMAVAIDVGEANDIHPKNKQEVGWRLAAWALGDVYGQGNETSGPLYDQLTARGPEVVLSFTHTRGGLVAREGDLRGFAVAGADRRWQPAQARIEGDRVVVSSPQVASPVAVRYAWASNPEGNLYNGAGLPASPFRTLRND